jgi:hypothetical protein
LFEFVDVKVERSETIEVFLRIVDDEFEGPDLMIAMSLVVANSANDALLNAFGFKAD